MTVTYRSENEIIKLSDVQGHGYIKRLAHRLLFRDRRTTCTPMNESALKERNSFARYVDYLCFSSRLIVYIIFFKINKKAHRYIAIQKRQ